MTGELPVGINLRGSDARVGVGAALSWALSKWSRADLPSRLIEASSFAEVEVTSETPVLRMVGAAAFASDATVLTSQCGHRCDG